MRVSRFKLNGDFAGKDGATIEIAEVASNKYEFRVRPKRSREDTVADLADIAQFLLAGGRMQVDVSTVAPPAEKSVAQAPLANVKKTRKKSATAIAKAIVAEKPWYETEE